jgi:hypothetical protein
VVPFLFRFLLAPLLICNALYNASVRLAVFGGGLLSWGQVQH